MIVVLVEVGVEVESGLRRRRIESRAKVRDGGSGDKASMHISLTRTCIATIT